MSYQIDPRLNEDKMQQMLNKTLLGRKSSRGNIFRGASYGRMLNRFKSINGKKYQLHATKGWRAC